MRLNRNDYFGLFAFIVIVSVTVDKMEDIWTDNHIDPKATIEFMNEGARNTASNGVALCVRMKHLEMLHDIPASDCCKLYNYPQKYPYCKK